VSVNTERLKLAITALESGEYPKGRECLHRIDDGVHSWCCLGVLTIVAVMNGLEISRELYPEDGYNPQREVFAGHDGEEVLCAEVADFYGLDSNDPELITPSGDYRRAAAWNDSGPLPDSMAPPEEDFTEIAAGFRRTFLENHE